MSAAIISHFVSVSSICTRGLYRQSRTLNFGSGARGYCASQFTLRRQPDDFIDAEIVSSTDGKKKEDNKQKIEVTGNGLDRREKKEKGSGSGVFSKLATFFGQDEESLRKKEQKKQLNTAIDKIFEGSGALGTVIGGLAKGIGGLVAESLYAATADLELIQDTVLAKIETDADCVRLLGGVINLSPPFSSSQSSMNVNGNVQKQFSYVMTASGNAGSGQVQVQASMDGDNKVTISQLILQTQRGEVINVKG
eukprot:CAMPEP_0119041982 /NCGR_PEP_ID=MMETSP1177-20130426/14265_1 /TAXON_ID=2985 /ORGANISM="Ochromonas sp, Strain CCMP1899" /LENGTH=250 /DNA_ID=CAMNT_0007008459 /DNA_START=231 /DNA_END=979 /DNA_ORIENTATION=-